MVNEETERGEHPDILNVRNAQNRIFQKRYPKYCIQYV